MSDLSSDLRRVVSSTGIYALASLAQKGLAFFLLPVYTRHIEPAQYGVLELLNAMSSVVFGILMMGLPSAINKCYHRDCSTDRQRASVLSTALAANLPVLLLGCTVLILFARRVSVLLVGTPDAADLVRLVVAGGGLSTLTALFLASLRARERALAFSLLSLTQFLIAFALNVTLVVHYGLGVRGVLWGNLVSLAAALPLSVLAVRRSSSLSPDLRLLRPLLHFGLLLVPVMLAGWVMELSDRYVLRWFSDLEEVAVYGVGYKVGMVLQLTVVWPFQLAWPAVSFSISNRAGHEHTYARTLTYLTGVMAYASLALSILSRIGLPVIVGEGYGDAYRVVPLVALAYVFNGVHYCVSPGVHVAGKTKLFPPLAAAAAVLNIVLNLLLVPRFGMMGAAWATVGAFLALVLGTGAVGQRYYPIRYEYGRLVKIVIAGLLTFVLATRLSTEPSLVSVSGHLVLALVAFPALLAIMAFLDDQERAGIRRWLHFGKDRQPSSS